jgi:tetratricopeptide (TPR) repeat protein
VRRGAAAVAFVVLIAHPLHAADRPGERAARVERWLRAVLHHAPGVTDPSVVEVASTSFADLSTLRTDEGVFIRLMRDPRATVFERTYQESTQPDIPQCVNCAASEGPGPRKARAPERIYYSDVDLHRLKVLACAAAGTLDDRECLNVNAAKEIDDDLRRLAARALAARDRGDANYVLRRAALLHTDAAIITSNALGPMDTSRPDDVPVRVHIVDGEPTAIGIGEFHWEMARHLLDAVRPARDTMVDLWYRATASWMQQQAQYNSSHLARARDLFPDDDEIFFLSGCEREAQAGPVLQSAAHSAVLPTGITIDIPSERVALRDAEGFFRRALTLNPRRADARLRLGHVLLERKKPQEAADELRRALSATADPQLRYFGSMFLGAAEEAQGHFDDAGRAYAAASEAYPGAQSPYLALSELARRRGDRSSAIVQVRRLFDLHDERDDPWWSYRSVQGQHADELLPQLRRPFLEERQ